MPTLAPTSLTQAQTQAKRIQLPPLFINSQKAATVPVQAITPDQFLKQEFQGSMPFNILSQTSEEILSPRQILQQEFSAVTEQPAQSTPGYAPNQHRQLKSNPIAPRTMIETMNQKMLEIQKMVNVLLGNPEASKDMAQVLGPNACFEDILAYVMMKIAREEEKKVMERIQILENGGHPGLKGWLAQKAGDLGGVAGGVLGAMKGGAAGAAVGQDVGKRLINSFMGYNSEDSRQIQFEKLKQQMNKLSELMTCMSNILANMHATVKNTISNFRG